MNNKGTLPLVLNNKSNLINYQGINLIPVPYKHTSEIRMRGSMFANMLNNIKQNIVNKSKITKNSVVNSDKENPKINFQVRNYYLNRKKSNQKYLPISSSISVKKQKPHSQHIGKSFMLRQMQTKKAHTNPYRKQSHRIIQVEVNPELCTLEINSKICEKILMKRRKEFVELPSPQWSVIISSQFLYTLKNYHEKLENLFSEMLFQGIDPCIRINSIKQLENLPSQIRDLCHVIYPEQQTSNLQSHRFFLIENNRIKDHFQLNQQSKSWFAKRILFLQPFLEQFSSKWFFFSQNKIESQNQFRIAYLKISDLSKIKNVWLVGSVQTLKLHFSQISQKQIYRYIWGNDNLLLEKIKFESDTYYLQQKKQKSNLFVKSNRDYESSKELKNKLCQKLQKILKEDYEKLIENRQIPQNKKQQSRSRNAQRLSLNHSNIASKARFTVPERQLRSQQSLMQLMTNNQRKYILRKNPEMMLQELSRNNTLISEQITKFLSQNQPMKEIIIRIQSEKFTREDLRSQDNEVMKQNNEIDEYNETFREFEDKQEQQSNQSYQKYSLYSSMKNNNDQISSSGDGFK